LFDITLLKHFNIIFTLKFNIIFYDFFISIFFCFILFERSPDKSAETIFSLEYFSLIEL
jgi:hypothetical protein